ncbi:MAG TPA: YidC/Oxa1 family membrane protein insertase [Candidatus Limnocylindrales bacterium]
MDSLGRKPFTKPRPRARWAALGLLLALTAFAVIAVGTASASSPVAHSAAAAPAGALDAVATPTPVASPTSKPTAEPVALAPATPGAGPDSLIGFLFTPIFQGLFLLLIELYSVTGNIVVAIILMTVMIRLVTVKLSAKQIMSQKRMQIIGPELRELTKELNRRYKGDRMAIQKATQEFYKERGISPTAGCLPSLLQMGLLFPMYWVIRDGLTNFDPHRMFEVFGVNLAPSIHCPNPAHIDPLGHIDKALPCINTVVMGINVGQPQVLFNLPLVVFTLGVSALALAAGLLQFVQSRMLMPPAAENDPSASSQRTMMVIFPFFSVIYGGWLPAGLFVYWITTSVFSIVQQFLIVGWGSMFPLFGWNPGFAQNHKPRFPVTMPQPAIAGSAGKSLAATRLQPEERWAAAASTVRPNTHKRTSRRGRRR